jgi:hypothetical protein
VSPFGSNFSPPTSSDKGEIIFGEGEHILRQFLIHELGGAILVVDAGSREGSEERSLSSVHGLGRS